MLKRRSPAIAETAALVLFDIDRFKEVNDTAGHQAGDAVLKTFAELVTASLRPGDLFGRLGGEEFACLLPKISIAQALQLAERIRSAFAALPFPYLDGNVTVSVGLAMSGETTTEMASKSASATDSELQTLFAAADRALYRAKAEGRNRVARTAARSGRHPGYRTPADTQCRLTRTPDTRQFRSDHASSSPISTAGAAWIILLDEM